MPLKSFSLSGPAMAMVAPVTIANTAALARIFSIRIAISFLCGFAGENVGGELRRPRAAIRRNRDDSLQRRRDFQAFQHGFLRRARRSAIADQMCFDIQPL